MASLIMGSATSQYYFNTRTLEENAAKYSQAMRMSQFLGAENSREYRKADMS